MKRKLTLTFTAITLSVLFLLPSCKYDEGPGISLRNKRDRIINVWAFESVSLDGEEYVTTFNTDSFICVFEMYKAGYYSFGYRYPDGSPLSFERPGGGSGDNYYFPAAFQAANNPFQRDVRGGGKWTFNDKHDNIQMAPELAQEESEKDKLISYYDIVKLRNDNLILKGTDRQTGKEITVEFVPLKR